MTSKRKKESQSKEPSAKKIKCTTTFPSYLDYSLSKLPSKYSSVNVLLPSVKFDAFFLKQFVISVEPYDNYQRSTNHPLQPLTFEALKKIILDVFVPYISLVRASSIQESMLSNTPNAHKYYILNNLQHELLDVYSVQYKQHTCPVVLFQWCAENLWQQAAHSMLYKMRFLVTQMLLLEDPCLDQMFGVLGDDDSYLILRMSVLWNEKYKGLYFKTGVKRYASTDRFMRAKIFNYADFLGRWKQFLSYKIVKEQVQEKITLPKLHDDMVITEEIVENTVYKAIWNNKSVVCKLVEKNNTNEILALKKLRHKHIVELLDVVETDKHLIMIEPELLQADVALKNEQHVIESACELFSTLKFLHANNVIHADISLNNVMFNNDGHVILIDFELCFLSSTEVRPTSRGTTFYRAPEVMSRQDIDSSIDIYAAGVVILQWMIFVTTGIFIEEKNKLDEFLSLPDKILPKLVKYMKNLCLQEDKSNRAKPKDIIKALRQC